MAELVTVATVFNAFVDIASRVQTLGENYYKASAEWKDFPVKVDRVRKQGDIWFSVFKDYGISEKALIDTLREAISLLKIEEAKLSIRQNSAGSVFAYLTGCLAKAHVLAFPYEISRGIQSVEERFAEISHLLNLKQEAKSAAEKESLNRPYSLAFKKDERYVPLQDTEGQIYSAVETSPSSVVVLLYGGPGRGKSSMARHVALHYKIAEKETSHFKSLFEQVVFLECGPEAEISTQQQKLLQQLGLKGISTVEDQQAASDISQLLICALRSRKILIILDDVWDEMFLQHMIDICGDNVKCLVTSQNGDLCSRLNCTSVQKITIQIQEISQEVGRKILAAHFRFQNQSIPIQQILNIADKMIEDTEGNPLALVSVISAIQEKNRQSPESWEEAYSDLQLSLKTEDTPRMFGQKYPRSFWSATKLSVRSLSKEAQSLLILIHLCKGPSFPEEVIRFLVEKINLLAGKGVTFRSLANQLEGRELLKINEELVAKDYSMKSWSTHSLQKSFMDEDTEMRELKGRMFESVLGFSSTMDTIKPRPTFEISAEYVEDEDATVPRVLAALYFEDQFTKKAASGLNILDDSLKVQRRQALEPITRLLGKPPSPLCMPDARTAAKQVFVHYFCKCELDDENISLLLKMSANPSAQFAAVAAIKGIGLINETPLLKEDSKLVAGLVPCLYNNDAPFLQVGAVDALYNLIWSEPLNQIHIVNEEGALAGLVMCMSTPDLQNVALMAVLGLTRGPESMIDSMIDRIVKEDGALQAVVNFLSNDGNPLVQDAAVLVLAVLAYGKESAKLQILNQAGALAGLVRSLANDNNPDYQEHAAWGLKNLAGGPDSAKHRILEENGALQGLVNSLFNDGNPRLQQHAAYALGNLAQGPDSAKHRILEENGALQGLVNSLFNDGNPYLQRNAVYALTSLALGPDSAKLQILNQDGALAGLVRSLGKNDSPELQALATWGLKALARNRKFSFCLI